MCICLKLLIPLILLLQIKSQTQLLWRRSHLPCVFELFAGPFLIFSHSPGPFSQQHDWQGLQALKTISFLSPLSFSDRLLSTWLHLKVSCLINLSGPLGRLRSSVPCERRGVSHPLVVRGYTHPSS